MRALYLCISMLALFLCAISLACGQTGPVLILSDPLPDTKLNIPPATIGLGFDQAVNASGVAVTRGGTPVPGTLTLIGALNNNIIFTPSAPLTGGTYTVDLSGVTSATGLPVIGTTSFSFVLDTTAPAIQASVPTPGLTGVALDTKVGIAVTEPLNTTLTPTVLTLTGPSGPVALVPAAPVGGLIGFPGVYVYAPTAPLAPGATYTVDYSAAQDLAGNPIQPPVSFTFTTIDTVAPTLATSSPLAGATNVPTNATLSLTFSENMDHASSIITLTGGATPVVLVKTSATGPTITLQPVSALALDTVYTVDFSQAVDLAGNPASPLAATSFSFVTVPPPALAFVSSLPTTGQSNVSTSAPIMLTFNNNINAGNSTVALRSDLEIVTGSLSAVGPILTFTPAGPLRNGTTYTLQYAGVVDIYGQTLGAAAPLTFVTEVGSVAGSVDPQMVVLAANQSVGITYLIRNATSQRVDLLSSAAEFLVDGNSIASVNVPVQATINPNSVATIASDVAISPQIQEAVIGSGTDRVVMMRTFSNGVVGASGVEISVPLTIRLGSAVGGPVSVTEILLDVPTDSKIVGQFGVIRGHAFVRTTGTGAIVGSWCVDERPVETFTLNSAAGLTQEVWTRRTLPAVDLGEHQVQLRVVSPTSVSSNSRRYVVAPTGTGTQRVFTIGPRPGAPLLQDGSSMSFRWVPMPGASGYEIAFAGDPQSLGLEANGNVVRALLDSLTWTKEQVTSGKLSFLGRLPSDVTAWTPTGEELDKLFGGPAGTRYWAVRAVYPAEGRGDPATTSKPRTVTLVSAPSEINLLSPAAGAVVDTARPTFEWEASSPGVTYELSIASRGRDVFKALTRDTKYSPAAIAPLRLRNGEYSWQVSAVKPGDGLVAASKARAFTAVLGAGSTEAPASREAVPIQTAAILPVGAFVTLLPGAVSGEIAITPATGSTVNNQQPAISATFPEAKPGGVAIVLNGVDVTPLAQMTATGFEMQPPGVFAVGDHTVNVGVLTVGGQEIQATSKFRVTAAFGETAEQPAPGASQAQAPAPRPLELDFNWNLADSASGAGLPTGLAIDINLRGQQFWSWGQDSQSALDVQVSRPASQEFDVTNFAFESSFGGGRYKALAGDTGTSGTELTAQGLTHRSFSFIAAAGPVKVAASHTLGKLIQRSGIGRAPDMLFATVENAKATADRGLKFTYVSSEDSITGSSGFVGPSKSRVLSLSGRTLLGRTGITLRGEFANSQATSTTVFGSQGSDGNAKSISVDGRLAGFGISASYRDVASQYASPASMTLTNNLRGLTLALNRPVGRYLTASANYSTFDNASGSGIPSSSVTTRSVDLAMARPGWPAISLRLGRNDASSDPFVEGAPGSENREDLWSLTASHAGRTWNGYMTYTLSDFDDLIGIVDPNIDVPNDRKNSTWAAGFGWQASRALRMRFDMGLNMLNRWFRPLLATSPLLGTDDSRNYRAQIEYLYSPRLSTSLVWSQSRYENALRTFGNELKDVAGRVNYNLMLGRGGGGLILTVEMRHFGSEGFSLLGQNKNVLSVLLNDNRLLTF